MNHRPPVLVTLDGSLASERAIPLAAEQARAANTVLHLVHVHELTWALSRDPAAATGCGVMARIETQARLTQLADRLGADGVRALAVQLDGKVEPTLLRYIARVQPALVIMAARGPTGVLRSRPGSITDTVLRASAGPVIVLPLDSTRAPPRPLHNVLVALDGSPLPESVLPVIFELAPRIESVFLVTVLAPFQRGRAHAQSYLESVAERLRAHDLKVCSIVREGSQPADLIVEESLRHSVDLIALTTHSRPNGSALAVGSCTDAVLRTSELPVLTVNPAEPPSHWHLTEIDAFAHA